MRKLMIACAALALAACQSAPTQPAPEAAAQPAPAAAPQPEPTPRAAEAPAVTAAPIDPLKDPASVLSKRSVYFDFDKSQIRPEFRPTLDAHGQYLRDHRSVKILIQGNADERGSREYNVGLGQRRADAVRRYLSLVGAAGAQVEAVSLGEEKPRCTQKTEACWAENRRADILYPGEY